jgi:hypothetical protein
MESRLRSTRNFETICATKLRTISNSQIPSKVNTRVGLPPAAGKLVLPVGKNLAGQNMAEADLDVLIRSIGKKQHKSLMDAAKKRHVRLMGLAAKAKNKEAKDRFRQSAKTTLALASAAARRLQVTAENAADSYARAMKRAADEIKKAAGEKPAKKVRGKKS